MWWYNVLSSIFLTLVSNTHSFSPESVPAAAVCGRKGGVAVLWMAAARVVEIRSKLDQLGIDYSDCFDKESLEQRLKDAKEVRPEQNSEFTDATTRMDEESSPKQWLAEDDQLGDPTAPNDPSSKESTFDEAAVLAEVRAMKVKELREELARRRIRWADLFEKEDLVRAVVNARKDAHDFSSNITPGIVADLTEQQVEEEVKGTNTPLLLDVYATWCGPCKMMAGELTQAAEEWKDRIRLAKMDSDKYPSLSSKLKVQGLPTIILFDNGQEVDRLEGALPKDQLMQWVEGRISP